MAPNRFVWYDLMTTDLKAAETFYTSVVGWKAADSGLPDRNYTLLFSGPAMVAGLMGMPEDVRAMGAKPGWNGHIGVDDVDAATQQVKAAGGHIHRTPEDIPNGIGRFSVVSDPTGAAFILFQPGPMPEGQTAPPAAPLGTPGHVGWHELHAGDGGTAWQFYSGQFGWTKTEDMDMGPMGIYRMFSTGDSAPAGGMMTKMAEIPVPTWLFYFNVDTLDAAVERIKRGGGTVLAGPIQVPGGSWIAQALDPQGTMFAVLSMTR